ncbi:ATP-dependent helicase, partial [Patescibacteria group bacterium]|nr:ATP-dependent helicase [Patescibacteria group bacterium]
LTFTDAAALEIRERLLTIVGEAAYRVRVATFHSFCNEIIQDNPELFAAAQDWQALAEIERVELWEKLVAALPGTSPLKPFGAPEMFVTEVARAVQTLKKEGFNERDYQVLLSQTRQFIRSTKRWWHNFFELKPTERSDAAVAKFRNELQKQAKLLGAEATMMHLTQFFDHYVRRRGEVSDRAARQKLRTRLKQQLKKWYTQAEKDLAKQSDLLKLYRAYTKELKNLGRYDYEDMVLKVVQQLQQNDSLLAKYQEQFQYVLVDEYQDTNGSQNELLRLLGSFWASPNICVVGDDNQSIFRFQGASLENLLTFYVRYRRDITVLSLTKNYRSQPTIIKAAQALIAHNQETLPEYIEQVRARLVPAHSRGAAKLVQQTAVTEEDEDRLVAHTIEKLIEQGVGAGDIAVLFRFNRDVFGLRHELNQRAIPNRLESGEDVLGLPLVEQLMTLLRYVSGEMSDELLGAILQYPWLGLAELDVFKVLARAYGTGLWSVVASEAELKAAGVSDLTSWQELIKRLAAWQRATRTKTVAQVMGQILQESGLVGQILANEGPTLLAAIRTLFDEAKSFSKGDQAVETKDFVQRLRLLRRYAIALPYRAEAGADAAVHLLTAHKAKGREFAHVFIIRGNDKHWGNLRERSRLRLPPGIVRYDPVGGQDNNEDERRLFYVALTRAAKQLYLTRSRLSSTGREVLPSLFWAEIPEKYFEITQVKQPPLQILSQGTSKTQRRDTAAAVRSWLEQRLAHYTMSVTHLNNYLRCPRLWYYRNLLRVPAAKTKPLAFGTAVHAALRDWQLRYREQKTVPGKAYLLKQFERQLQREPLTKVERADCLDLGREALSRYHELRRADLQPKALVEFDFKSHGVRVGDLPVTGKIDKIDIAAGVSPTAVVIDYKTGNPDRAAAQLKRGGAYWRQLVFYKMLGERSERFKYTLGAGVIDFVQASRRTGATVRRQYDITDDDVAELVSTIKQVWQEIKELDFLTGATRPWCGKCQYCLAAS